MMRFFLITISTIAILSCAKHENRMEGSWFVNYFINDSKIEDFKLKLNSGGTGQKDGLEEVIWSISKKKLIIVIDDYSQEWENSRNKRNTQFYISNDSIGNYLRMEMERIK